MLFSDPLDNADMVGGENEIPRNQQQNYLRTTRIENMIMGSNKEDVRILDFGCGHGYLVRDLHREGFHCDGYDAYNEEFCRLPEKNKYHIATAIEVIEHTSYPFAEIEVIHRALKPGGVLMVETSFVDVAVEENIALEDFFYINPKVGHSTIFSHHALDVLMARKGLFPIQHWNRHVRGYKKY